MVKFCNKKGFYCPKYTVTYCISKNSKIVITDKYELSNGDILFIEIDLNSITEYEILKYLKLKFNLTTNIETNYVIKFKSYTGEIYKNMHNIDNPDLEFTLSPQQNNYELEITKYAESLRIQNNGIVRIKMQVLSNDTQSKIQISGLDELLDGAIQTKKTIQKSYEFNDLINATILSNTDGGNNLFIKFKSYQCTYKSIPLSFDSYLKINYDSLEKQDQIICNTRFNIFQNDEKIILTDCFQNNPMIFYIVNGDEEKYMNFETNSYINYYNLDTDDYIILNSNEINYQISLNENCNRIEYVSKNSVILKYYYDDNGKLLKIIDISSLNNENDDVIDIVQFEYDSSNRLSNISYIYHDLDISFEYDANGFINKYNVEDKRCTNGILSENILSNDGSGILFECDDANFMIYRKESKLYFKNTSTNNFINFKLFDSYFETKDNYNNTSRSYLDSNGNILYNVYFDTNNGIIERCLYNTLPNLSTNNKKLNCKNYFINNSFDMLMDNNEIDNPVVNRYIDNNIYFGLDTRSYTFEETNELNLRSFKTMVNISGNSNEKISVSAIGKFELLSDDEYCELLVNVFYRNINGLDEIKTHKLEFNKSSIDYQFVELQIISLNQYYKLEFVINYYGKKEASFSNVYINKIINDGEFIYNKNMELIGRSNTYDVTHIEKIDTNSNNKNSFIIKNENGSITLFDAFNQLNPKNKNLTNNSETKFTYEDNNIIEKITISDNFKKIEKFVYKENDEVQYKQVDKDFEYYNNNVYNLDTNCSYIFDQVITSKGLVSTTIEEYKGETDYENEFEEDYLEEDYLEENIDYKKVIKIFDSNNLQIISKYYYSNGLLKIIATSLTQIYKFEYDDKQRVKKVLYNNIPYIEYEYSNNHSDLITIKKYDDNKDFQFNYDSQGKILSIYYNTTSSNNLVSSFEYDEFNKVTVIKDGNGDIEYQYFYDDLNNIKKEMNKNITITYDNDNNGLKAKSYHFNNTNNQIYYSYSSYSESINNLFSKLSNNIYCDYLYPTETKSFLYSDSLDFVTDIEYDENLKINIFSYNFPEKILSFNLDQINKREENTQYRTEIFNKKNYYEKVNSVVNLLGFFKINKYSEQTIYTLKRKKVDNDVENIVENIEFRVSHYDEIILNINNENCSLNVNTGIYTKFGEWNILGLTIRNNNNSKNIIDILVNNQIYTLEYDGVEYDNQNVEIGVSRDMSLETKMKLAYLTVGSRDINEEELRILYNDFNEIFNDKNNNFNVNVTNYERFMFDGSDKVTLNNTFKTIRGDEPTIVYTDIKYCNSLERYFKYSTELNKYCYVPTKYKNSYLQYDIQYNSYPYLFVKGLFKPFSKENGEYYTLFTITSKQTNEELLKVSYKHPFFYVYRKGLERQDSSENVVALSYDRFNKIMIHNMDDALYLTINNHQIEFDSTLINEDVNIIIGNDSDNNAFSGLISDLEFGYSALNDIDFKTSFINKFDSQGRLRNKIIKNNNNEIKTIYSYYDEVNSDNFKTLNPLCNRIKNYDGSEEIISYDDNNSIIKKVIINNNIIQKIINYTYDDFNRLVEQVEYNVTQTNTLEEKYKYIYEYDTFGNIIKSKEYFESNLIKDLKYIYTLDYTNRLIKVIDDTDDSITNIEYNNSLYPNKINNNVLEYQGNRLIRYNNISYEYNTQGKRTKKINNTENYTVNYYYENDNLVRQVKGNIIIDYIYNNNIIEGLVYNNTEYYFVRDITGCIEKIIDKNKKTMVLYRYSSYGEVYSTLGDSLTSSEETIAETLRNNNGFVYKGYYYDVETNLFLVSSRYYSPELCRWISPDDIEYLDPESVNGLNLYCYCMNNPIMYVDPTGHFAMTAFGIWAIIGIVSAAVVIGGGAQLASNALAGETGSDLWRGVAGAAIGSGVNALALCLSPFTGGASLAFAAGLGAIAQTGVDTIETLIRGEDVSLLGTALDLGLNFATTFAGNWIGSKLVPTNAGWFKPQKFLSVFTKPYGQKILLQTVIGAGLSAGVNFVRKFDWSSVDWKKFIPVIPVPVVPTYPYF